MRTLWIHIISFGAVLQHEALCLWTFKLTSLSSKQRNGRKVEGWESSKVRIFSRIVSCQQLFMPITNLVSFSIGNEGLMEKEMVMAQRNPGYMTSKILVVEVEQFLLQGQMLSCNWTWMYVYKPCIYSYYYYYSTSWFTCIDADLLHTKHFFFLAYNI